jgi:hypothetical protein
MLYKQINNARHTENLEFPDLPVKRSKGATSKDRGSKRVRVWVSPPHAGLPFPLITSNSSQKKDLSRTGFIEEENNFSAHERNEQTEGKEGRGVYLSETEGD